MNTSPISAKVQDLQTALDKISQIAQAQFLTVTFNATAHGDTEITHALAVGDKDKVHAIPVRWEFASLPVEAPFVYVDTSRTRRAWTRTSIVLRCNLAGATATLLLLAERVK